ncbi:MAG: Gfo/Idh/MocA family oxidoreductase [Caldimonas sp.]
MSTGTLLVGLGVMGKAYAAVLQSLQEPVIAIGRSEAGVRSFTSATGLEAKSASVETVLARPGTTAQRAIVCVPVEDTASVVAALLDAGVRRILVEKPGATTPSELDALRERAGAAASSIFVAYNRRFYASVAEARRRIEAEGGVDSFQFEFTERESDAAHAKFPSAVKQHWGLANSSHVIDLAFHLGGAPARLSAEVAGALPWHPGGARFAGSGMTEAGALFSYGANWTSGGRWSVELMTQQSRLILRPLEQLAVQRRGSFEINPVALDNALDLQFKPGLHRQTAAFLGGDSHDYLVTLDQQTDRARKIFGPITGEGPSV